MLILITGLITRYFIHSLIVLLNSTTDDALKMCRNIARQYSYFYTLLQVVDRKKRPYKLLTHFQS